MNKEYFNSLLDIVNAKEVEDTFATILGHIPTQLVEKRYKVSQKLFYRMNSPFSPETLTALQIISQLQQNFKFEIENDKEREVLVYQVMERFPLLQIKKSK